MAQSLLTVSAERVRRNQRGEAGMDRRVFCKNAAFAAVGSVLIASKLLGQRHARDLARECANPGQTGLGTLERDRSAEPAQSRIADCEATSPRQVMVSHRN